MTALVGRQLSSRTAAAPLLAPSPRPGPLVHGPLTPNPKPRPESRPESRIPTRIPTRPRSVVNGPRPRNPDPTPTRLEHMVEKPRIIVPRPGTRDHRSRTIGRQAVLQEQLSMLTVK